MTDICQELTLGPSGLLRTISGDLKVVRVHTQSIFRVFSLDELPDLASDRPHHFEQSRVRLLNFVAEELKNAQHFRPEENGKAKRRMQIFSRRDSCTRKIPVLRYILYPDRSRAGPDPTRQAYARSKSAGTRVAIEFLKLSGGRMPGLHASQCILFFINPPNRPNRPAKTFANCLQDLRSTNHQIRCFSQNARDRILSSQPHVFK